MDNSEPLKLMITSIPEWRKYAPPKDGSIILAKFPKEDDIRLVFWKFGNRYTHHDDDDDEEISIVNPPGWFSLFSPQNFYYTIDPEKWVEIRFIGESTFDGFLSIGDTKTTLLLWDRFFSLCDGYDLYNRCLNYPNGDFMPFQKKEIYELFQEFIQETAGDISSTFINTFNPLDFLESFYKWFPMEDLCP